MSKDYRVNQASRRKFVKTVAYVTPAILTLKAIPSFASGGSGYSGGGQRRERQMKFHHDGARRRDRTYHTSYKSFKR